jgi:predicted Zn finger-like uncharacterized protein
MVITCGDCGASFRLDVALLQGAKGGRFRCRRCGGKIVAQRPEAPTVLSADDAVPIYYTGDPTAAPAQDRGSPWPVEPSGPAPSPQPEAAGPGPIFTRLEDMFVPPAMDAAPDTVPPGEVPAEEPVSPWPVEPAEPEPGRTVPSRRASSRSTFSIILLLCLLLLAAGALYFGTTKPGRDMLGKLFPGWGSTPPGSVAETPYDIRKVKWSIEKETAGGTLFVVQGEVANVGNATSAGIGIRATLLGKDNQALAEKTAFAGNLLDNASLGRMDRPAIEAAMSNRFGEGDVNREIPPGKALPFMVLFFDPPVEIDAVMVKAIDAR